VVADEDGAGRGSRDRVRIGLGVMARAPSSPGKTRLAPHLSEGRLRALREAFLADTLRTVSEAPLPRQTTVFVEPGDAADEVRALIEHAIDCEPQVAGDLGGRMRAAFVALLQTQECDGALLVGTDVPLLTREHLDEARDALETTQGIVLGPAEDGGYYLIGMRSVHRELFEAIEWGSPSVLADTRRIAECSGIEARLIRACYDVDTIEDLRRLEEDLRSLPPHVAPHVRTWFSDTTSRS
jgi:uncharacterized protein